ncbi:MAG TPA: sialidase family protein [Xanthobacteraceae bacterium]|jgi:hypothetical protein|nr:sialidase family protein [Xanthobacteraceae bacterium]
MIRTATFAALAIVLSCVAAPAQMSHQHASEAACDTPELRCATKVTPTFAADGTLWLAWMAGGRVSVAASRDLGRTFSTPAAVSNEPLALDWGPDARPKIVVDRQKRIFVAFSIFRDKSFNGEVLYTRSVDGGRSFVKPKPITPNTESQRFEALALDADGSVFATWLDKRNRVRARANHEDYNGAALFFAWSKDGGATYSEARMVKDDTCECCRLAVAFAGPGRPVVLFRNIFPGSVRDHAIVTFRDPASPGEVYRVSNDDWQIEACPHQGPSLAISPTGSYHAVWFTGGKNRKGLFYARSTDGGKTFSEPVAIGRRERNPSRPYVLVNSAGAALVWKEFDGEKTSVNLMTSDDDGKTWSQPKAIAATSDASDHPLLVSNGRRIFLSWMTKADGYQLLPIEDVR